ncbi:MAG: hypothetical protein ABIT76_10095 [Chthoniobacterales bacterium]
MSDPIDPTSANSGSQPEKRHNAEQDKKITNYANEAATFLDTLLNDATLKAVAVGHGYDDAALTLGSGYVTALGGKVQGRQLGMGQKEDDQDTLVVTEKTVRADYAAYRLIARASFPDQADRTSLGLTGDVPEDVDRFVTLATTSYTNSGLAPYTAKMTLRNYAPARLATLLAQVKGLTSDEAKRNAASGGAVTTTKDRDGAYTNCAPG